jgi:hypothetical protein
MVARRLPRQSVTRAVARTPGVAATARLRQLSLLLLRMGKDGTLALKAFMISPILTTATEGAILRPMTIGAPVTPFGRMRSRHPPEPVVNAATLTILPKNVLKMHAISATSVAILPGIALRLPARTTILPTFKTSAAAAKSLVITQRTAPKSRSATLAESWVT